MEQNNIIFISKVELQSPFFKVLYQEFDKLVQARNLATNGKGSYQTCVKEFFYWLELRGINKINRVTSTLMIDYLGYLHTRPNKRTEGTLSESMVNQHLFSLRMLVDYLLETNQIESAVIIPKNNPGTKRERDTVTRKEIELIYDHCSDKRERAILSVSYGCGLRRFEMKCLKTNDVNFSNGILVVREGKLNKRRDIPMSDSVIRDLKDYLVNERFNYLKEDNRLELAFFINNKGKQMQGDNINKIVKEIIARTNDSLLKQKAISLHSMRHSIAMHLLDNGADMEFIQSFLGHEEIDTSHIYARKNKQKQNKLRR